MARTDNFTNFATDVANSIRSMTGKTDKIPAADFDTEIKSIETKEDLTEELNTYNTEVTEQGVSIDTIINALEGKAAGSGSGDNSVEPLYLITNGYDVTNNTGGYVFEQTAGTVANAVGIKQTTTSLNLYTGLWARCHIQFNNEFALSKYSFLYIDFAFPSTNVINSMSQYIEGAVKFVNSNKSVTLVAGGTTDRTTVKIPLDGLLDSDNILITCANLTGSNGQNSSAYTEAYPFMIYNVWLEGALSLQDKTVEITENGTTNITADEGYVALNSVTINTNVSGNTSVQNNLNVFVQEDEPSRKTGVWLKTNKTYDSIYYYPYSAADLQTEVLNKAIPFNFLYGFGGKVGDDIYLFAAKTAYKYTPSTDTYTQLANIPVNFQYAGGCVVGTDIYLLCGAGSGSVSSASYLYKYDTLTNAYTKLANRPVPSTGGKLTAVGNALYAWGCDWNTSYAGVGHKYDITTNTWTEIAKPPRLQCYGSLTTYGMDIYMLGSAFGISGTGTPAEQAKVYRYNTVDNTYTEITSVPLDCFTSSYMNSILVGDNIYMFSVNNSDYSISCNYKYNIPTDTYTKLNNFDFTLKRSWSLCYNSNENTIYAFGGDDTPTVARKITLPIDISSIDANSIVLDKDVNQSGDMSFKLLNNFHIINDEEYLKLYIKDALYYIGDNVFDNTIPTYYGNGTEWVKFKN